jgi:hypothetical protein
MKFWIQVLITEPMKVIDEIRRWKMLLFESFWGLVAPESDTNRWNYKFTWAPVCVSACSKGGQNLFKKEYKYIPYCNLFRRTEFLEVEDYGRFEAYSNRFIEI